MASLPREKVLRLGAGIESAARTNLLLALTVYAALAHTKSQAGEC